MRSVFKVVLLIAVAQSVALAQSTNDRRGWGYGIVGIGGTSSGSVAALHVGVGGEGLVYKGLGVGAEVVYAGPLERFGAGFGILSTDVSYHFAGRSLKKRLVPFVTGGYSMGFRSGVVGGGNIGGGVQYWVRPRLGLRFEFRDHIFSSDSPHFYAFRFGVSFR
jgi:hypothetical protein